MVMPKSYNSYACPNCKEPFLEGRQTGAVRIKCQACKHIIEFVGERKPHSVDLGTAPLSDGCFVKILCAECGRRLCDHKGGGWFLVKCPKCRNNNVLADGAVTSIGRDCNREKL